MELAKNYDPKLIEDKWYKFWLDNNYFRSIPDPKRMPYTIIQPPPNSNNMIHIGHAINNIFQDILIRFKRLQGYNCCWIPGLDHGGISSVQMYNKYLKSIGKDKSDMTRQEYNENILKWIHSKRDIIVSQMKKIGLSCDWDREQFTMSKKSSSYVNNVFKELYEKGFIYQGSYMINQCVSCCTALSNDEVDYKDNDGKLYYIKYKLTDNEDTITVATTRPETLLGDTAIACNPTDDRYKELIGKYVNVPLTNRSIPIIADNFVQIEFGTGLVKITPSHNKDDHEVSKRHNLPKIDVIDKNGKIFNTNTEFDNLDRFDARNLIVKRLSDLNLLDKKEDYKNKIGVCYRCKNPIESIISTQWFIKTQSLRDQTMDLVNNGKIKFTPEYHANLINKWMETDIDWCISRQNWGHPIPIWKCNNCKYNNCDVNEITKCNKCNSANITMDGDFLDTWFSSSLWAFSVFDNEDELKYYFPSDVLVTGSDILFFWVARMIMMTSEIKKSIPFKNVLLHGVVRDANGIKMAKTLGNGIDPIKVIDEYSADVLRFTMIYLTPKGQDTNIGMDDFKLGQTFCTKLWNCVRYIITNINDYKIDLADNNLMNNLTNIERWIFNKLNISIDVVTNALETYNFSDAIKSLYSFVWDDLCNCYLEYAKSTIDTEITRKTLLIIINNTLKLLYPFIPFLTDELHEMISKHFINYTFKSINDASLPTMFNIEYQKYEDDMFRIHTELIKTVRNIKAEYSLNKYDSLDIIFISDKSNITNCIKDVQSSICKICNIKNIFYGMESIDNSKYKYIKMENSEYKLYIIVNDKFNIKGKIDLYKKRIDDINNKIKKIKLNIEVPNISPKKVLKFNKEIDELLTQIKLINERINELLLYIQP